MGDVIAGMLSLGPVSSDGEPACPLKMPAGRACMNCSICCIRSSSVERFDLCGRDFFPISSKVQGEWELEHDLHGWPSSHLILRRRHLSQARLSLKRRSTGDMLLSPWSVADIVADGGEEG